MHTRGRLQAAPYVSVPACNCRHCWSLRLLLFHNFASYAECPVVNGALCAGNGVCNFDKGQNAVSYLAQRSCSGSALWRACSAFYLTSLCFTCDTYSSLTFTASLFLLRRLDRVRLSDTLVPVSCILGCWGSDWRSPCWRLCSYWGRLVFCLATADEGLCGGF